MLHILRLLLIAVLLAPAAATAAPGSILDIVPGVDASGRATEQWQAMIRKRLPEESFLALEDLEKPFTANERAWADMIASRKAEWEAETLHLAAVFHPLAPPHARIVLGNRGGEDAFTHDPHTIGFDISRLHALYGDGASAGNRARMDRFFRHEYTHLLQKAWFEEHPLPLDSPFKYALAEIFAEGMGNYHSLSDGWRTQDGVPAKKTLETLRVLEPRFVTRLAAIACASPEQAKKLRADLSMGRFDRKWGALPAALWLELEPGEPDAILREFLLAGPEGIWALAERHLPPDLKPVLQEIRSANAICETE